MLTYALEHRGEDSLYAYLYKCIRRDIEAGVIDAHEKLPSKRALARHLGVSLITVEGAYAQLAAEGYVYALERKGYFASPLDVGAAPDRAERLRTKRTAAPETAPRRTPQPLLADFTGSAVAPGLFPYSSWAKTVREALSEESEQTLLGASSAAGSLRLRETLATYLAGFRGMRVDPSQIVVGAGAQTLYNLIVQLLGRNRRFAVEDPGYPRLTQIYRSNDVPLSHVPMDESGISLEGLRLCGADICHIMPSHQFPTGLVTPISRRYELLGWASECEARCIVEDDYDCEFRLAGKPISPLQAIDAAECVIYTNTFTKSLGPAFRIGYMVLPMRLAALFEEKLGFYSCTVSAIDQLALARFIENGDYERHVNRMRSHYRTIRNELIDALKATTLADRIAIEAQDSGLHFILGIESESTEEALAHAALVHGVALAPLSRFYAGNANQAARRAEGVGRAEGVERVERVERAEGAERAGCARMRRFVMSYSGIAREAIGPAAQAIANALENG